MNLFNKIFGGKDKDMTPTINQPQEVSHPLTEPNIKVKHPEVETSFIEINTKQNAKGETVPLNPSYRQIVVTEKNRTIRHPRLAWVEESEQFLKSKGWTCTGTNESGMSLWQDPHTSSTKKPEMRGVIELPLEGGSKTLVKQLFIPPIPYSTTMEQALSIQYQRDQEEQSLDELITIKEEELNALKEQRRIRDESQGLATGAVA